MSETKIELVQYEIKKHIERDNVSYAIHANQKTINLFLDLMESYILANKTDSILSEYCDDNGPKRKS